MSGEHAILSSELENWPSKEEMCQILEAANIAIYVGRYSIRIKEFDHFVFREYGGDLGKPCITADSETTEELARQAHVVSKALANSGIKHRFEVYDSEDELAEYIHHNWPKEW